MTVEASSDRQNRHVTASTPLSHRERRDFAIWCLGVSFYGSDHWIEGARAAVGDKAAGRLLEHLTRLRQKVEEQS